MICGGYDNDKNTATNKCHQFNANSMSWNEVNPLKIARYYHAITSIGQSLVTCGGWTASYQGLSSCEILTNGNGQWTTMKPLPTTLSTQCLIEKDSSTIVSLGGYDESGTLNKMYEYNMLSNQWTETNTPMNQKRNGHECVKISEDKILVIGGHNGNEYLKSTELYDKMYDNWSTGPTMPKTIASGQFIKASPGSQFLGYFLGGYGDDGHSSDIYGLSKDLSNFQLIGNFKKASGHHVAFRLPEGISDKCGD